MASSISKRLSFSDSTDSVRVNVLSLGVNLLEILAMPKVIVVSAVQPENGKSPIIVTELGIVISVRVEQSRNAPVPTFLTEFGMLADVSPVQPANE